jgi:predicted O-methyltransferase YrrM
MDIISATLQSYLEKLSAPESDLLKKINRETHLQVLMPRMLSGHYQGRALSLLSKLLQPKCILEIGTFTGYATLCLAEGLSADGELHTIDCNLELEDRVRGYFDESEWAKQIFYHLAKAEEFLSGWTKPVDLVFIDADKKNNALYYDLIFDFVKPGGIILIDNVLWSGKVLQEDKLDKDTSGIVALNEKIAGDTRVEPLLLPIRDGLWVIRKK